MALYTIGDTHLSLAKDKPMDIFGEKWKNHAQKLKDGFSIVGEDDLTVICGDISWGMGIEETKEDFLFIDALPGKKIILKGNHDYYWSSLGKMRTYFPSFNFVQNNAYRVESPDNPDKAVVIAGSRGWNIPSKDTPEADVKIYKRELIRLELSLSYAKSLQKEGDKLIAMLHYPPFEATYQDTEVTALVEKYDVDFVLYGHLHGKNARVTPTVQKHGITYILTSCDLVDNKLIEVCEI